MPLQDLPSVLPQLQRNVDSNASVGPSGDVARADGAPAAPMGAVHVLPLTWGDGASAAALLASLPAVLGDRRPSLILGADIVYHEHLIDILVDSLVALSDGLAAPACGGEGPSGDGPASPPIVISYVQRFKRAKRFLKQAKRFFRVDVVQAPSVVDYDVLNWGSGTTALTVDSESSAWPAARITGCKAPATGMAAGGAAGSGSDADARYGSAGGGGSGGGEEVVPPIAAGGDDSDSAAVPLPARCLSYYYVLRRLGPSGKGKPKPRAVPSL